MRDVYLHDNINNEMRYGNTRGLSEKRAGADR